MKTRALVVIALLALLSTMGAHAQIPSACAKYQWTLTRALQKAYGPGAPVADYAGQVMQESSCNKDARSVVGATGLTQFMPATANWIPELDAALAPANPSDPEWAIRAQIVYMRWLIRRNQGATDCDTFAFALSAYNGGELWVKRDRAVAAAAGKNPAVWFGSVDTSADARRKPAMVKENKGYPFRILRVLAPRFVAAGWGASVCK